MGIKPAQVVLVALVVTVVCAALVVGKVGATAQEQGNVRSLLEDVHAFDQWLRGRLQRLAGAGHDGSVQSLLDEHGSTLARRRLAAMGELIKTAPTLAFENMLPFSVRQQLSGSPNDQLCEQVISDISTFGELAGTTPGGGSHTVEDSPFRVRLNNKWFKVFWQRPDAPDFETRQKMPFWGIAVGNLLVVHETAARQVAEDEFIGRQHEWKYFGTQHDGPVLGEVAGHLFKFNSESELRQFIPPSSLTEAIFERNLQAEEGKFQFVTMQKTGDLNVLIIRVDFSDMPGEPKYSWGKTSYPSSHFQDLYGPGGEMDNFYRQNSQNALRFSGGVTVSNVLRMSNPITYYSGKEGELQDEAYVAYFTATGIDANTYKDAVVLFTKTVDSIYSWAGLAWIGAQGAWCNGFDDLRTMGHEIGHNVGAYHAKFLRPQNGFVVEYGNSVDIMGCCPDYPGRHFNTRVKNIFGWIPSSDIISVTTSTTVSIRAHDFLVSSGPRAIKITLESGHFYWLEHRQAVPNQHCFIDSAILHETWSTYSGTYGVTLLDATPETDNCFGCNGPSSSACLDCELQDTPIVVGAGYSSSTYKVHIHVKSRQGTAASSASEITVDIIVGTNNCWGHGTLQTNATCTCHPGYSGIDCSVSDSPSSDASSALNSGSNDQPSSSSAQFSSEDANNTHSDVNAAVTAAVHNVPIVLLALLLSLFGGAFFVLLL